MRPFWWLQMDVFEDGALKKLTPKQGRLDASREILALRAAKNLGLTAKSISSDPINPVISSFQKLSNGFGKLLQSAHTEAELQR